MANEEDKEKKKSDSGDNSETIIVMPESVDILAVESILEQCKEATETTLPIIIEGSKIEHFTTPAIQLLLAMEKSVEKTEQTMALREPAQALVEVLTTLGLGTELENWKEA